MLFDFLLVEVFVVGFLRYWAVALEIRKKTKVFSDCSYIAKKYFLILDFSYVWVQIFVLCTDFLSLIAV